MADVMDLPPEPLPRDDKRRDRVPDRKERSVEERRRDRDPRERRDDRGSREDRRDYYDRRSVDEERDRDKDYKRRRSSSPPSYSYRDRDRDRDRRYSPSRRSPPYKRSKRDDDYRGSSPRSGMVPSDDRRVTGGGRSNSYSGDERGYGRHPDGPYSPYDAAPRREGLMTYKQFISELEDDISPQEAERRYEEYKSEFISTQKHAFFEQNKHEDWLREKYDPSRLDAVIQRRNEMCRAAANEFMTELESGALDISPGAKGKNSQEHASDDETNDTNRRRRNGRGPAKEQEFDAPPKAPAVSSEPRRVAKDIEQARALMRKMDGEKGIEMNILLTSEVDKSEGEKTLGGGGMNPMVLVRAANQVKGYEGLELLDVVLTYLWRIHYVDYYGTIEYKEPPKTFRHVRTEGKGNDDAAVYAEWEKKLDVTWEGRLQGPDPLESMLGKEKIETATIEALDPYVRKIKDEKYGWKYGCGAKGCTKLFHGPEFVHKHLKLKHSELVSEVILKVREDLYFQNYMSDPDAPGSTPIMASQRDRSRRSQRSDELGPMLKNASSGRGSRDASRGGRGSSRDDKYERARDDERFDREGEHTPSHDFPPTMSSGPYDVAGSSGPFEGGRGDATMFDAFSGPTMRGPPPFGSDMSMPPPVLMPVPGAGPLGPFVPAPPEVAMRMWREQGGSGPFHPGTYDGPYDGESSGAHGSRRRSNSRRGTGAYDSPPVILPLPNLRHDSRRALRSYRDLDAPEDEVTVIDYRSL